MRVQAAQALVRWLAAAPGAESDRVSIEPPVDMQRPSRLLELTQHHARLCWRLAEHATLRPADTEGYEVVPPTAEAAARRPALSRRHAARKSSPVETCVEVVACHTRVDVVWQDGRREADGAATSYAPAKHVDGYYEFWPQDYVITKSGEDGAPPKVGVIESVNHAQRLCVVTWRGENGAREVVPVYEISPHPDFAFKVGDIVLRLPTAHGPHAAPTAAPAAAAAAAEGGAEGRAEGGAEGGGASPDAAAADAGERPRGGDALGGGGGEGGDAEGGDGERDGGNDGGDDDGDDDADDDGGGGGGGGGGAHAALRSIGEVVAVGARLHVRWMDGSFGYVDPEEAYVVNTEEEDDPCAPLEPQPNQSPAGGEGGRARSLMEHPAARRESFQP